MIGISHKLKVNEQNVHTDTKQKLIVFCRRRRVNPDWHGLKRHCASILPQHPLILVMSSKFKLDSRGKRSDSLESLDSDTQIDNGSAEYGWRKAERNAGTKAGTRLRTNRRCNSNEGATIQDAAGSDSGHPVNGENPPLSSHGESTVLYETDMQELSGSQGVQSTGFDAESSTPDSKQSSTPTQSGSNGFPPVDPPAWSGSIAGKLCSVVPNQNIQESWEDESIKYEADLDYRTAHELMDPSFENDTSLGLSASPSPGEPPFPEVCLSKSESLSSDDDFNDDVDSFPLLHGRHAQCMARNFAMEHRIFIKCLMALLEQRDLVAVDMDDPNTLKCGPLKKATHLVKGAWKVKFVEIRRGIFSYYDDCLSKDAASEGDLVRKNVRLIANGFVCRAVKLNHKSLTLVPGQAIFELTVEGSPRRFWMANSREERSAWIRAIHDASVGGAITRDEQQMDHAGRVGRVSRRSPYKRDLETYLRVQRDVKNASNKQTYVGALAHIVGMTLNVPVKWISEQNHLNAEEAENAFREDALTTGVNQLWKDLARDSVKINGDLITGGSGHAPERIVGAVTREILRMDRSSPLRPADPSFVWKGVTELQALSFARDVLLSCNRTRSGGDSYYCVDALTNHPGMVVLVPSSLEAEPLSITVVHYQQERPTSRASYSEHDRGGWLKTRTRQESEWKRLYFVLSEGTLSIYRKGHPRPYGLEAQIKVAETPMYVAPAITRSAKSNEEGNGKHKKRFVLTMKSREGIVERQCLLDTEDTFLIWVHAFEEEISKHDTMDSPRRNLKFFNMLAHRDDANGAKGDDRIGFILGPNSLEDNAEALGFDPASIVSRAKALELQHGGGTKLPTVSVQVRASSTYKICTLDPQGNENEDTWA